MCLLKPTLGCNLQRYKIILYLSNVNGDLGCTCCGFFGPPTIPSAFAPEESIPSAPGAGAALEKKIIFKNWSKCTVHYFFCFFSGLVDSYTCKTIICSTYKKHWNLFFFIELMIHLDIMIHKFYKSLTYSNWIPKLISNTLHHYCISQSWVTFFTKKSSL